jgi:hypothetical protein
VQAADNSEKHNVSNAFRLSVAPMMDCPAISGKTKQGNLLRLPAFSVAQT